MVGECHHSSAPSDARLQLRARHICASQSKVFVFRYLVMMRHAVSGRGRGNEPWRVQLSFRVRVSCPKASALPNYRRFARAPPRQYAITLLRHILWKHDCDKGQARTLFRLRARASAAALTFPTAEAATAKARLGRRLATSRVRDVDGHLGCGDCVSGARVVIPAPGAGFDGPEELPRTFRPCMGCRAL